MQYSKPPKAAGGHFTWNLKKKKERKKEFRIKLQRQCHRELVVPIVEEVGGRGQREIPPEAVTFIKTRLFNRAGAFQYFAMR